MSGKLAEPAAGEQVVDRADQVLDVDDQHRPAVFEHRGAIDIGHLAQPRIQRRDAQVALAQEPVDHHAEAMAAVAGNHDRQELTGARSMVSGQVEDSGRLDQAHGLIVEHHVLLALELAQVVAVEHEDAVDPAQGEGIGLAGDLDEQGTDDRHGDRQLEHEPRSLAGPAGDADRAAHCVHHALNHVEPDAAAGDLGDLLLGREPGQEEEIEQLGLAQPGSHRGGGQSALDDLGAEPLQVDATAVVGKDDLEHPRAMARLQADGPHGGLPAARRSSGVSRPWSSALRIR